MRWTIFQLSKLEDLTLILKGINSTGLCCFQGEGDEINIDSSFFFCLQPVHSFVDPHFSWVSAGWFMQKQDTCFSKIWTTLTFILCHILRIVISFVLKTASASSCYQFFSLWNDAKMGIKILNGFIWDHVPKLLSNLDLLSFLFISGVLIVFWPINRFLEIWD